MTIKFLSDGHIKYLQKTIKTCCGYDGNRVGSMAARRESAMLMLNLNGYKYDFEKQQAYKESGNLREYVPIE